MIAIYNLAFFTFLSPFPLSPRKLNSWLDCSFLFFSALFNLVFFLSLLKVLDIHFQVSSRWTRRKQVSVNILPSVPGSKCTIHIVHSFFCHPNNIFNHTYCFDGEFIVLAGLEVVKNTHELSRILTIKNQVKKKKKLHS